MSVSERGYLSIGEVLALLQEEFPDVTISKIRFLESQGLIEPERTHSGYRKFYGPDVERLRFILREQREHYLPLRVIRDRLEAGPGEGDADADAALDHTSGTNGDAADAVLASGAPAVAPLMAVPPLAEAEPGDAAPATAASVEVAPEPHVPLWLRKAPPGVQHRTLAAATPEPEPAAVGAPVVAAPAAAALPATPPPIELDGDAELTLDELLQAAGVTAATVRELESFGLLTPRVVGRTPYYDGAAVTAARLAAGFQRHGIEARHLRLYKTFVEREAALFEQVVLPLTKQRNPRARVQASEALQELSQLGASMRQLFVTRAVRDLEP